MLDSLRPDARSTRGTTPENAAAASVPRLLLHGARCLDLESAIVLAESALNKRLITLSWWRHILAEIPARRRAVLLRARRTSQSGSETRVGYMLDRRRIPFTPQAVIPGVGTVDALVKDIWVIECDSRSHHSAERDYVVDRRRDLGLQSLGYIVTRLSFLQLWVTWDQTQEAMIGTWQAVRHRTRRPHRA